ncbi:hypothetical protein [Luteimonas sp. 3794]|uniref:hypothetical protein n=1 Tax=Luteimonas sp. 3794 TaxID=2817730 RepID=UPI00285B33D8|nr:hypothetical protein [Luteimonas sp. 3794]MDR6990222.1 hypothetical protein [Luteimonas sp. 3794]
MPKTWPPALDFPVVIDALGNVVSRYGDSIWNFTPLSDVSCILNFGDRKRTGVRVDPENADVFRLITAWWIWGPRGCPTPRSLKNRHEAITPLFVACTEAGICATDLYRYPKVIEELAARLPRSTCAAIFSKLTDLLAARDSLGFVILDEAGLALLASLIPERVSLQTAYIPPRIWTYQVGRLRECLDDYIEHQAKFEKCYRFCLAAYEESYGGSFSNRVRADKSFKSPFNPQMFNRNFNGNSYGPFCLTARRFGIEDLLERWVNTGYSGIKALSSYMTLICRVGLLYVLNFSLMRIDEGFSLRAGCFRIERDDVNEDICILSGSTTKTVQDATAQWIVSPSVEVAIRAMTSIARLRLEAAMKDPSVELSKVDKSNPLLQSWAYEPWSPSPQDKPTRKTTVSYAQVSETYPKLFDKERLRITAADLEVARQITFNLDPQRFSVGVIWPLANHQLRRTGSVNMLASGLVSDSSLQYQLKHASRAMSRYYGQNYYRLSSSFDEEARGVYLKEMYRSLVSQFKDLASDRFISPYNEKRKAQILLPISGADHAGLIEHARAGRISYRENFLGGCAKPGIPCELGGISNVSGCMGHSLEKPCEFLLLDREKRALIDELRDLLGTRQSHATKGSPLWLSLQAQIESTERAIDALDNI